MRIVVLGAGSWGTALATVAFGKQHDVWIWSYERRIADSINRIRRNDTYLPDVVLPSLKAVASVDALPDKADLVISALPSHAVRSVWSEVLSHLREIGVVVSATKGIDPDSLETMSEVLSSLGRDLVNPDKIAVLSGPSFAGEVGRRLPTAVVVASHAISCAQRVQSALSTERFRIYTSDDVVGVEMGGALKNVIAIGAGIADGLGLGYNARAAVITRGLAEITRVAVARGANPLTLAGLSGMGDVVLTCTGHQSRNRTVGVRLGQRQSLEVIRSEMLGVAEGVRTARSCLGLARQLSVEMPISRAVHDVLHADLPPSAAAEQLMGRRLRRELD